MTDHPEAESAADPVLRDQVEPRAGAVERVQRLVDEIVALLAGAVARLRSPLRVLALLPVGAGGALLVVTLTRGGPDVPFALTLAVAGSIPGLWLGIRRHQLVHALEPPGAAAAEITAAFAPTEIWARVRTNLAEIRPAAGIRPAALARKMWQGVKLGATLRARFTAIPRLAPFLPRRLRGLAVLGVWCLGSALVLTALTVLKFLTAVVGIG